MTSRPAGPRSRGPSTTSIHADRSHNPTNAISPPIFQTSTWRWNDIDEGRARAGENAPPEFYGRWASPNGKQLEAIVAALEGAEGALATASGMSAAAACVMPWLGANDHVVAARTLYGEMAALLSRELPRYGVQCSVVSGIDATDFRDAMRANTRLVVIETPANPTMDCLDIAAIADVARSRGARLVVDNTFATPMNTTPLALGAHAVFHSATKYLAGHSDVIAGVLATDREGVSRAWDYLRVFGPVLGPFESWLVTRGLRTLALRMQRHNENGLRVAEFLAAHGAVGKVNYPGLATHPTHGVAAKQMRGFGGMISIELRGGEVAARAFASALEVFTPATSLGGVESLVQWPASLAKMNAEQMAAAGIGPGLVRLSVGCEDVEDLVDDLGGALRKC